MWRKAPLIVFSGMDNAGKSTQIDMLIREFQEIARPAVYFWARPGYTPGLQGLKDLVRRWRPRALPPPGPGSHRASIFSRPVVRRIWLTSAILELGWFYGLRVRWWQQRGYLVICDRYLVDALVDVRVQFPQDRVEGWWCWRFLAWVAAHPDAAFMLLVPPAESVRRGAARREPFPDPEGIADLRWAEYLRLAKEGHWIVLDGRRSVQELSVEVREELGSSADELAPRA
jgi:thymidylate kinase